MLSWLLPIAAWAVEPPWRWITSDQGLVAEHVDDLAQAPDGFLWLATHAGVYRYDGLRAERMDGGVLANEVFRLVVDGEGRVFCRMGDGALFAVADGSAHRLLDATGGPARGVDLDVDAAGQAWALSDGRLWRISGGQLALDPDLAAVKGAQVARYVGRAGWVIGDRRSWLRVAAGAAPRVIAATEAPVDAAGMPDGSVWLVDTGGTAGGLVRHLAADDTTTVSFRYASRAMGVAVDGTRAWASFADALVKFEPDGPPEVWGPERGVTTGGRVRVDDEGSLWIPTFRGVAQLFEPDAALWTARDGLPAAATRFVVSDGDRVWLSGWGGAAWLDPRDGYPHAVGNPVVKGALCVDAGGGVWALGTEGLDGPAQIVRVTTAGAQSWPVGPGSHFENGCAEAPDGGVYVTASDGLYRVTPGGAPTRVAAWWDPGFGGAWKTVVVDARGRPWVAGNGDVCTLDDGAWRCLDGSAPSAIVDLVLTERGEPWIATATDGVSRRTAHGWEPIPGVAALPSRFVMGLRTSPRGGVWVLGHGVVQRVVERPDLPDGWQVEETLAGWLGHLVSGAQDVLERPDGDLWIAHNGGLTHIPADTRAPVSRAPPVSLVAAHVDGEAVVGEASAASAASIASFRFAAASFVSPARLRYRSRLDGGAWSEPAAHGTVDLRGLAPGRHRVEVAASLDGQTWTASPASATVVFPRPWYGRWELWVGVGAAALVAVGVALRIRAEMALRLERVRSRIALDLHDQVGAGLGSIGLLGGLLGRPGLPAPAAAEAARRVATTAEELGLVLRGIVWSLRPESARLDQLGAHLAERARGLLPDLDAAGRLEIVAPTDRETVDLEVLRTVQLIGLEALHNVAKHAKATRARLAVEPVGDGRWRLIVEDDGVGVGDGISARLDGGNGLRGMRARAAAVHAPLVVEAGERGGTRVTLTFRPRRWARWLR